MTKFASVSVVLAITLLTGCANRGGGIDKQQGGLVLGGATGALIGSQFGHGSGRVVGAGVGGIIGALAGSEIGKSMDRQDYDDRRYRNERRYDRDYDQRYRDYDYGREASPRYYYED